MFSSFQNATRPALDDISPHTLKKKIVYHIVHCVGIVKQNRFMSDYVYKLEPTIYWGINCVLALKPFLCVFVEEMMKMEVLCLYLLM